MEQQYSRFFSQDRTICGGQITIAGTRVPVRTILASLAEGATIEEIVGDFPTVSEDAVKAVIAFAAAAAAEDLPIPSLVAL
ncbi:MAG: DUF433 domain-containing protein [Acidobacteria bacterium]|nr:DUF433 domain-containing protein [Acidobacteriota bacterium]